MALINYFTGNSAQPVQQGTPPTQPVDYSSNINAVKGTLESMLAPGSSYIDNARQRGMELAATRGGINSSIAAGAAERSAIEAAAPLAQQALTLAQQEKDYQMEDWLANQNFSRALYGQKFSNSMGMLNAIQQYALEDPELYTPEVMSGFTNFFQQNMNDMLSRYL